MWRGAGGPRFPAKLDPGVEGFAPSTPPQMTDGDIRPTPFNPALSMDDESVAAI